MSKLPLKEGRLLRAPENFLSSDFSAEVLKKGLDEERRSFLRRSFLAASAAVAATGASGLHPNKAAAAEGELAAPIP